MPSVRMKTTSCGPLGNRFAGKVYPVTAEDGADLVAGGFAEWVDAPRRSDTPVEVAVAPVTAAPVENAARQTRRRQK